MEIVERLTILLSCIDKDDEEMRGAWETVEDAADEIERLREDKLDALAAVESENAFYQEEIERLRDLGLTMRNAQKKYFKERTQENLIASKQAEKAFDDALKEGE